MTKQILISAFALAVGLSACNESALPTDPEQLSNPSRELGDSKFGQVLSEEFAVIAPPSVIDPVSPTDPVAPGPYVPGTGQNHVTEGADKSKWYPRDHEHIRDDHNRSKYKPNGYEHIKEGNDKTKYKPGGWIHYNGERTIDKTKYIPDGYKHISSGPNETRYSKNGVVTSAGDAGAVADEEVTSDGGVAEP